MSFQKNKFTFGMNSSFQNKNIFENKPKRKNIFEEEDDSSSPPPIKKKFTLDDDDDDNFLEKKFGSKINTKKETVKAEVEEKKDEEDELEKFMAGIDDQLKKESEAPKKEFIVRDDIEEEDYIESYVNHMKKKGIDVGKTREKIEKDLKDIDSDEEVYSAARAIDEGIAYDSDDNMIVQKNKEIEPLPPVNHDEIEYAKFEKYFYKEHPDIAKLSEEEVKQIRKDLDMWVTGHDVAKPCISFGHFGFDDRLINAIIKQGFTEPTGIQRQAIPVALSGRDLIGIAKTGSGKTASFVWPMIIHILDQPDLEKGDGPIGLILAPTRELAHQIYIEAKKFAKVYNIKVAAVYGGESKADQFKELRNGYVEILVATPGRLIDMIKMKATNLRKITFLVLDEADRMLDLGFEPQVRSICNNIRPDRQVLMFSATFPKKIEKLTRDVLHDPVKIHIGNIGASNTDIEQHVIVLQDDSFKWNWLISNLVKFTVEGSVLVFVGRKAGVDELAQNLKQAGFDCLALHGDLLQMDRDRILYDFKHENKKILVCTDVASRGLDIKSVKTVVNYDVARDIDSHVHRIGRTGRAGEKGTAYTLITQKEDRFAVDLIKNLEDAHQVVPPELIEVAKKNPRFRKRNNRWGNNRNNGRRNNYNNDRRKGDYNYSRNNANEIPLGGNNQYSSSSFSNYSRNNNNNNNNKSGMSKGYMSFTKAKSDIGRSTSSVDEKK
jgi:ATP-dependent RNA helicase DDX42